jgi:4-amino-4-deoxy-L-arabinose transferase-like glycosyltransferase
VSPTESPARLAWYAIVALLAVVTYFYGLGSQHIPNNGDEYPYLHIARLTAASGHLLPLQSELNGMRNTKPPMLSWQGIASSDWGQDWSLWRLRLPSVVYTLLDAVMAFLLAWKLSRRLETGFVALLSFLAFFSTYRYGRPYLTNAPEAFWLFLPFFVLLYWQPKSFGSRFLVPVLLGLGIGVGLLYKSFALVAPVGFAMAWWYLHQREYRFAAFLAQDSWKVAIMGTVALTVFCLWFLLDPYPRAIWDEFILTENLGKFDAHGSSYLGRLLWSSASLWTMAVAFPFNAGALFLPVAAMLFVAYKRRHEASNEEKLLWIWVITLWVFFTLPGERSSRNLLSAMPAVAVLCALYWDRISRWAFITSLVIVGAAIAAMAYLSLRLQREVFDAQVYPIGYWLLLAVTGALVVSALVVPKLTRPTVNATIILTYLSYTAFLLPFDGPLGNYEAEAQQYAKGKDVWVPCNFRAKDERYRFILPGAQVHGYKDSQRPSVPELSKQFPLFAAQLSFRNPECPSCKIIGQRTDIRSRYSSAEIKEMLEGKAFEYLFVKELLIEAPGAGQSALDSPKEGCR